MTLGDDPRWRRFNDATRPCPCCGRSFSGVFDIAFDHPDAWPHGNRAHSGQDYLGHGEDLLGTDHCMIGDDRYLRCILPIPILGTDQSFAFGPWGSVSQDSFRRYTQEESTFDVCFSWLANHLPGVPNDAPVPCDLRPGGEGKRPILTAHATTPLATLQHDGITFDQLLDIYAVCGQDIRPHLTLH